MILNRSIKSILLHQDAQLERAIRLVLVKRFIINHVVVRDAQPGKIPAQLKA
jgi:hypothetical protein